MSQLWNTPVSRRSALLGGSAFFFGCSLPGVALPAELRHRRHYANCRYGQLHFRIAEPADGAGDRRTPLVCLHQSPGSSLEYLEFQAAMASDRRVLCPDTAGYGASDGPGAQPDIADYSEALAEALIALGFGADGAGPVDVLGFHTGNFVAAELAIRHPELVRRMVMPSVPYFSPQVREQRRHQFAQPRPYFSDPDYVGESYRKQVIDNDNGLAVARNHDLFVERLRAGPNSHFAFDAVFRYDADSRLGAITQPVLLPVLDETLGEATRVSAQYIKGGEVLERKDLTGLSWFLQPEELVGMTRKFLDRSPHSDASFRNSRAAAFSTETVTNSAGRRDDNGIRRWRRFANNQFGQLHFASAAPAVSDSPPLLLLHQSPLSSLIFRELVDALATDRMVHAADTPGFGDSDGPSSQPTMQDYGAATVEALIDLGYGPNGRGPIDLFGFHTGSFVAAEVARQAPDIIRRVILCGVPYYDPDMRLKMQNQFLRPYAFYTDPNYVDVLYKRIVVNGDNNVPQRRRLERFTDRMRAGPRGEWGPRAVFAYDADAGLAGVRNKTLLMAFEEVMTEPTRQARKIMPAADFVHLADLGMMGFMTQPQVVADAIRGFLDQA